jgi:tricorn protease
MSRDTLTELGVSILRASHSAERLILDLRNNGGGREADRMLALFCQPLHSRTVPRDGPAGYPLERRPAPFWGGPLVVLANEDTFSNAEIFCHAVKHVRRAPLVGTATAGGVISAVKTVIPDVGELQIPFRGWFHAGTGANLDAAGAQPDYPVDLTPADEDAGRDPQLEKALEILAGNQTKAPPPEE